MEHRVEAHIMVAFLGYSLMETLNKILEVHAPGLTARAVLESMAAIQMIDVWLPTTDGRTVADHAALYAAGKGAANTIGKIEMGTAAATAAAHPILRKY